MPRATKFSRKIKRGSGPIDRRDRLMLKMLVAFDVLGRDPMARVDARLWAAYFRRRIRRLASGVLEGMRDKRLQTRLDTK